MKIRAFVVFAIAVCSVLLQAQSQRAALAAREWRKSHEADIIQQFTSLLSIPNVDADRDNIQRNANLLVSMLQKRGVDSWLLKIVGANPIVFREIKTPNAKHTMSSMRITMASR